MFRVGVHHVPAAQAGLVRALVQLLARGSSDFHWSFAREAPYDALIVDSQSPDLGAPTLRHCARALSVLGHPTVPVLQDVPVLEWPLRAERLESWLSGVQRQLPQRLVVDPVSASVDQSHYRLKRWPPDALMRADRDRVRLASLLSRRHLSAIELAQLSGQQLDRCTTFLQMLQGFGLLDVLTATVRTEEVHPAHMTERSGRVGLVRSIRRRLGI